MYLSFNTLWLPPVERDTVTPCPVPTPRSTVTPPADDAGDAMPRNLVLTVARAVIEALSGYRPVTQLARWLTPAALDGLAMARRHGTWKGTAITRVWATQVSPRIIEGVAHVRLDDRSLALPIRLECEGGRWSCTHLGVLLPGSHMRS
ncbi:MAG: Rv3235 family protein [Propionibacteriaceae bacterium]|nr:Rv3235 family protein [Propionibacteriaceae bacterium]